MSIFQRFPFDSAFRISWDLWLNDFHFGFQPVLNILNTGSSKNWISKPFAPVLKFSILFCYMSLNGKRPCYSNTVGPRSGNYASTDSAEECYSETQVMLTKIVGSYCVIFDDLLAQAIIVGMWININATNSKETQRMPELMAAANYCSTCLLRQNNSINFGNVTRTVFPHSNKKIHIQNLTKMIIKVTARDRDYFLRKLLELQGLH